MDDDSESELLVAPATKARKAMSKIKAAGESIFWNRILMTILLVCFVVFGLFSESQIMFLQSKLESTESQVHDLQVLTEEHEKVIERFNQSVTNEDVLDRLSLLEQNMTDTVDFLHSALQKNEDMIQSRLDEESKELQDQVTAAETEIHNKVSQVEDDFRKYYIETKAQFSMENSFMVYQLAGTFTLLSCLISMWHMTAHLRKLNQPMVQRKILAILWMSPVYAITSWFSLVFPKAEGYLAIVKDGYEAYIIYQFLSFCIAVIGKGDRSRVVDILATHADHLTPPFRLTAICELCGFCKPQAHEDKRQLADEILLQCQFFALQFVFFRPLTTTAMVFLNQFHYYGGGDGPMDYRAPQLYLTVIQNISIFVAFTGLLKFYHAVDNELAWCRPLPKFLCIKGVVFMTFWQGLVIAILAEETTKDDPNAVSWADSAQNFLICLEMLLFSIAHFYCFPTEEWQDGYRVKASQQKFGDSIALGDFFNDIKLILRKNKRKSPKKKSKSIRKIQSESIPELLEEPEGSSEHTSTSFASEEEENIFRALNESLGDDADDPEIAEATRRLLESNVLSPDFFNASGSFGPSPSNIDIEAARKQLYGSHDEDDVEAADEEEDESCDEEEDEGGDEEEDQSGDEEEDQSGDKVEDQSGDKVEDQSGDKVKDQSGDKVEDQSGDKVEDQSGNKVEDQSGNKMEEGNLESDPEDDYEDLSEVDEELGISGGSSRGDDPVTFPQEQQLRITISDPPPNPPTEPPPPPVSPFMEALRPSIFTTVASMAEMERIATDGATNDNDGNKPSEVGES